MLALFGGGGGGGGVGEEEEGKSYSRRGRGNFISSHLDFNRGF